MTNFAFLQSKWPQLFTDAQKTESSVIADPRTACFYARRTLEQIVEWNRKNFWQALTNLSGNPLFAMIHPRELLEQTRAKCPSATLLIESIVKRQPGALLKEDDLATETKSSFLTDPEKIEVISNLWRTSMANICYDYIRNAEVHGPGSGGLSFDETIHEGRKGVKLDFDMLYAALYAILKRVVETRKATCCESLTVTWSSRLWHSTSESAKGRIADHPGVIPSCPESQCSKRCRSSRLKGVRNDNPYFS